eukprot:5460246-Pyramimonas_sp.AAC.1
MSKAIGSCGWGARARARVGGNVHYVCVLKGTVGLRNTEQYAGAPAISVRSQCSAVVGRPPS